MREPYDVPNPMRGGRSTIAGDHAAVRAAGIPEEGRRRGLTFHLWRHWYDSYLRGKVPDHTLQQLTRHKTERLLDHYSHITEEQRQAGSKGCRGAAGGIARHPQCVGMWLNMIPSHALEA